jgi:hypothetical protein
MTLQRLIGCLALSAIAAGCNGPVIDSPYESCAPGEGCSQGTICLATTLPASAGYTGDLCTNYCNSSADCLQDLTNYAAICVNTQCYIQCPGGGSTCPYGTACLVFTDQGGNPVSLCTP